MIIAQISDTHIAPPGQLTCAVAPMAQALTRVVAFLNQMRPRVDLTLLSGDVTHAGTTAEAEHALEILMDLDMPFRIVPGNHDDREVLAKVFGPDVCPMTPQGTVDHVFDADPIRIIALDTLAPGRPGGKLAPAQLDWLRFRLDEAPARPTLLVCHHPPLRIGVPETDEDGFEGAEKLADIVAQHPNIQRILCGHVHLHTTTRWCGTLVTTAPSIGMQLTLDLTRQSESGFWLSDPAFLLHHWTPDHLLVTHLIQLTDKRGPFAF